LEDKVRLVIGIGTGLGACTLVRPDHDSNFYVYSSEPGCVKIQLYEALDRQFEQFLSTQKKVGRDDIEMFLSGRGLSQVFEFLAINHPK
jgi:glucokinase